MKLSTFLFIQYCLYSVTANANCECYNTSFYPAAGVSCATTCEHIRNRIVQDARTPGSAGHTTSPSANTAPAPAPQPGVPAPEVAPNGPADLGAARNTNSLGNMQSMQRAMDALQQAQNETNTAKVEKAWSSDITQSLNNLRAQLASGGSPDILNQPMSGSSRFRAFNEDAGLNTNQDLNQNGASMVQGLRDAVKQHDQAAADLQLSAEQGMAAAGQMQKYNQMLAQSMSDMGSVTGEKAKATKNGSDESGLNRGKGSISGRKSDGDSIAENSINESSLSAATAEEKAAVAKGLKSKSSISDLLKKKYGSSDKKDGVERNTEFDKKNSGGDSLSGNSVLSGISTGNNFDGSIPLDKKQAAFAMQNSETAKEVGKLFSELAGDSQGRASASIDESFQRQLGNPDETLFQRMKQAITRKDESEHFTKK